MDNDFNKYRLLFDPTFNPEKEIIEYQKEDGKWKPIPSHLLVQNQQGFQQFVRQIEAKFEDNRLLSLLVIVTNRRLQEGLKIPAGCCIISRDELEAYYGKAFAYPLLNPTM